MGKKIAGTSDKVQEIPEGMPFIQLRLDLIGSPAWHGQSINCRRLIEFLLIEHMHHAGQENGNLLATYDQLVAFGISRKSVQPAITEAEQRGLIRVERGGRKKFAESHLSRFTLTFFKVQQAANEWGKRYWTAPTDDWKRYHPARSSEIISLGSKRELDQCPNGNSDGSQMGTVATEKMAENCASPAVPKREPPYISWPQAVDGRDATSPPSDPDQQPVEAKRQRKPRDRTPERDPNTIDLVDWLDSKDQVSPADRLRTRLKAKLATAPKGTHKRLAARAGISSAHLSNFLVGKFGLNQGALACLRDWVDGKIDLAAVGVAAA